MNDPINYCTSEDFYSASAGWGGPTRVDSIDPAAPSSIVEKDYWRGVTLKFNDNTYCAVQYVRPTTFRIRFDPTIKSKDGYRDETNRNIIGDYQSRLIKDLDAYRGITWNSAVTEDPDKKYWVLTSTVTKADKGPSALYKVGEAMKLYIYKDPFRIQAVRTLSPHPELYPIPAVSGKVAGNVDKTVWQSSPRTFRWNVNQIHGVIKDVVLEAVKPGHGEYIGFGEQGGMSFMKKPTFMNYFNFDNMQYQQIYNHGPLDTREPLYHSDPFWIEVNANPEHQNVTSTFIDNYSQIAMDFGKTNSGSIKIGTRFGGLDLWMISADTVPDIVRIYTGFIGRPKLKPKYVLGNHQACYGYETAEDVLGTYNMYRSHQIPLDGLHVDVDFQDGFRTFTTNPKTFPDPKGMFKTLRDGGVKCSTNITPVISINDRPDRPDGYSTLREGLKNNYFLPDHRWKQGTSGNPNDVRYLCYGGGSKYEVDPRDVPGRPDFGDQYDFNTNWDSGYPYHGGVSYGYGNGTAGFYPDLNRPEVREWWGRQYTYLFEQGLEFVWQDMTTPAIHTSYGDMKGLPSRLIVSSDAVEYEGSPNTALAIEVWALYSYNLHKATAKGLELLPGRENKRNFILGRGSFAGMYRFAGLWSGDNASTWDFWKITISQVLSVGLNGVSVSGADCGGFEPFKDDKYCSPELLIRWYSGSFGLPWLRNHYVKKNRKWFQEPYAYPIHLESHPELADQAWLYQAVERCSKYYIELRYSLLQLLYDCMFENQIHGLPIARSMLLTDTQDTSFFNESQHFLDNQYVIGRDILVAPITESKDENPGQNRDVYLPLGSSWYPSNLRPWDDQGAALGPATAGGSVINYTARITNNYDDFPYVVPSYIREGGIIPQIKVRQYVGDVRDGPNKIKFNIYPGKNNSYDTYLDDGVSRSSAPTDLLRSQVVRSEKLAGIEDGDDTVHPDDDQEAKGEYRGVCVSQVTTRNSGKADTRTVTVETKHNNYNPAPDLGSVYTIILWFSPEADVNAYNVNVSGGVAKDIFYNTTLRTLVVDVKEVIGNTKKVVITASPK